MSAEPIDPPLTDEDWARVADVEHLLAGPEPDWNADPVPRPLSDERKATAILYTLRELRAEVARLEGLYGHQMDLVREAIAEPMAKLEAALAAAVEKPRERIAWLETWLANWHEAQDADKRPTIHLPSGDLVSRPQLDEWEFDPKAFLPWAEDNAPALIRRKPEVAVNAAKKALVVHQTDDGDLVVVDEHGQPVPGVTVTARPRKYTAKTES